MANYTLLTTRRTETEAQILASRLEADGISCLLSGNRVGSVVGPITELNTSWANPLGGVELRVAAGDVQRAETLLQEYDQAWRSESEGVPRRVSGPTRIVRLYAGIMMASLFCYAVLGVWPSAPRLPVVAIGIAAAAGLVVLFSKSRT